MEQIPDGPNKSGLWFLKGRALWCAAQFAETVDKEAAIPFFHACCVLLEPANAASIPIPVKMAAVRAIARFCPCLPAENLRAYIPAVMQVLCSIMPTASDDSLVLLLNSVLTLTKVLVFSFSFYFIWYALELQFAILGSSHRTPYTRHGL